MTTLSFVLGWIKSIVQLVLLFWTFHLDSVLGALYVFSLFEMGE